MSDAAAPEPHPSDSRAQRDAELAMIAAVARRIGVPLAPKRITWASGAYCDVDGVAADESVLVEAYAHHGKMVGAHKKKVTDDALKLVTLARTRPNVSLIIALADEIAAQTFLGSGWRADALRAWEIEVLVVDLDRDLVAKVQDAQAAQLESGGSAHVPDAQPVGFSVRDKVGPANSARVAVAVSVTAPVGDDIVAAVDDGHTVYERVPNGVPHAVATCWPHERRDPFVDTYYRLLARIEADPATAARSAGFAAVPIAGVVQLGCWLMRDAQPVLHIHDRDRGGRWASALTLRRRKVR